MVQVKKDLTGMVFGKLTVIKRAEDYVTSSGKHYARWLCECSCEEHNKVVVWGINLTKTNSPTQSCGCLIKENAAKMGYNTKKYNEYDLSGEFGIGLTTNTNQQFYFDLEDYDLIKKYCWSERIDQDGYSSLIAWDFNIKKNIKMSYLLGFKWCDHINRNPLDNRKTNFRTANPKENARNRSIPKNNTSGIIGVCWYKAGQKWHAQIRVNQKTIHLGYFNDKTNAIVARLQAELKYWGLKFSPQRHLFEQYGICDVKEDEIC